VPFVIYGMGVVVILLIFIEGCEIGIVFIAALLPVYTVVDKVLHLDLPFANSFLDSIIGVMVFATFLKVARNPDDETGPSPMLVPIALLFVYTLFSFLWGHIFLGTDIFNIDDPRLKVWKNYMIMPILYLVTFYGFSDRRWKYALFILLFISFLVADFKFRQSFQWVKHTRYMDKSRVTGTLGYLGPNEWAAFQSLYTLFAVGLLLIDQEIKRRLAYLLLIFANSYSILYSYSRGAYVTIIAGLAFVGIVRKRSVLVLLVAFLMCWEFLVPLSVLERVKGTYEIEQGRSDTIAIGETELATAGRTDLWKEAISYFLQNPLMGTGFGTYSQLVGKDTHSVYLKIMAEQGIIGLMIYLGLYLMALRSSWLLYKNAEEQVIKALGFGFLVAVVGSIVANIFGDRWIYLQIGGLYWIIWGLVDQENSRIRLKANEPPRRNTNLIKKITVLGT
jgi:O-antigen ligase